MSEEPLHDLEKVFGSPLLNKGLNQSFRRKLQEYAKSANLTFAQDNGGNIYITFPGRDSSLSSIALSFPLDDPTAQSSFSSAFKTCQHLSSLATKCLTDVTLTGFTSPSNNPRLGLEVWEGDDSSSQNAYPKLKDFSGNTEGGDFAFSARLEVEETDGEVVLVRGSPLLADQARTAITHKVQVEAGKGPSSDRCAVAAVKGKGAVEVACAMVVAYGEYVKKLFDNFD